MMLLRARTWIPAILVIMVVALYAQVGGFDFVNYDDKGYFYDNPQVTGGLTSENVRWAFEIHGPSMWIPFTWLSHQAAVSAFGSEPGPHHWINVALHALNTCLLFYVIAVYTKADWRAGLVAGLFALHPIHVESVAWITERKDVLSMAFVLLTLLVYHSYAACRTWPRLLLVGILHCLAVGAKPLAVTVPCILLLLDFWPLGRITQHRSFLTCAVEKLPLLLISLFASWMTILCQLSIQAIGSLESFPLHVRMANAVTNYATYLRKLIAPVDLVPFYPYELTHETGVWVSALLLLIAITLLAILRLRQKVYAIAIGWFWFLGAFVPMIGLVQAGSHAMADRYAYLPFIGIYISGVWLGSLLCQRLSIPLLIQRGSSIVLLGALAYFSFVQIGVWRNSETLFTHTVQVSPENYLAHNNLGLALKQKGEPEIAYWHFRRSLRINPVYAEALNNAAISSVEAGDLPLAASWLERSIQHNPQHPTSHHNLAKVRFTQGQNSYAARLFRRAIELNPDFVEAHYDLGCLLLAEGRAPEAIDAFNEVLQRSPTHQNARINLGVAFRSLGQMENARRAYEDVIAAAPGNPLARANLSSLQQELREGPLNELKAQATRMREAGDREESLRLFLRALEKDPQNADLQNDVGVAFGLLKEHEAALIYFDNALRINPKHRLAVRNRAAAEAALAASDDSDLEIK